MAAIANIDLQGNPQITGGQQPTFLTTEQFAEHESPVGSGKYPDLVGQRVVVTDGDAAGASINLTQMQDQINNLVPIKYGVTVSSSGNIIDNGAVNCVSVVRLSAGSYIIYFDDGTPSYATMRAGFVCAANDANAIATLVSPTVENAQYIITVYTRRIDSAGMSDAPFTILGA